MIVDSTSSSARCSHLLMGSVCYYTMRTRQGARCFACHPLIILAAGLRPVRTGGEASGDTPHPGRGETPAPRVMSGCQALPHTVEILPMLLHNWLGNEWPRARCFVAQNEEQKANAVYAGNEWPRARCFVAPHGDASLSFLRAPVHVLRIDSARRSTYVLLSSSETRKSLKIPVLIFI